MKLADSPQIENYKDGIPPEETPVTPREKMIRALIYILLLAVVGVSIFPYIPFNTIFRAKTGTLTGQVVGPYGDPLNDVLVYIDQEWVSGYTDAEGTFTLNKVTVGEHFLIIEGTPDVPEFFLVNIERGTINDAGRLKINAR